MTATALRGLPWAEIRAGMWASVRVNAYRDDAGEIGWTFPDREQRGPSPFPDPTKTGDLVLFRGRPRGSTRTGEEAMSMVEAQRRENLARVAQAMRDAPPRALVQRVKDAMRCSRATAFRWMDSAEELYPDLSELRQRNRKPPSKP